MSLKIYMDQHVPRAITMSLRARRVDVLTAYEDNSSTLDDPLLLDRASEDNSSTLDDPLLLDRASELGRVLFTRDDDLLAEANRRQQSTRPFGGVIYAHQRLVSIGQCVQDLEIIALTGSDDDVLNRVIFLPL